MTPLEDSSGGEAARRDRRDPRSAAQPSLRRSAGSEYRHSVLPEQPTAPYLDAVVAYGFRGSLRFDVPGHKAGYGADPGLRSFTRGSGEESAPC